MIIEIQPFNVPNFVVPQMPGGQKQDGITFPRGIPLRDVDAEELATMCDNFRREIFRKAGKKDPSGKE